MARKLNGNQLFDLLKFLSVYQNLGRIYGASEKELAKRYADVASIVEI